MSSIDALWSELKEEEHRMRRTPKASAGIPCFSTHLAAPPDNATIATAGIAGTPRELTVSCAASLLRLNLKLGFFLSFPPLNFVRSTHFRRQEITSRAQQVRPGQRRRR
jgi:hypothetical protein